MSKGNRKWFNLVFLAALLLISTSLTLLHTDSPGEQDPYCPGCVFQSTSIATAVISSLKLPDLVLQGIFCLEECIEHSAPDMVASHARSPPRA